MYELKLKIQSFIDPCFMQYLFDLICANIILKTI